MKTAVGIVLMLVGMALILWAINNMPAVGERDPYGGAGGAAFGAGLIITIIGGYLLGVQLE